MIEPSQPLTILPPIVSERTSSEADGSSTTLGEAPVAYAERKKRKAEGEAAEDTTSKVPRVERKVWSCTICSVSTTSEEGLKSHLSGKKHKAKTEAESTMDVAKKKEWRCTLCMVSTTDEDGLKSHLNGKKHKAKARAAELALGIADSKEGKIDDAIVIDDPKEEETEYPMVIDEMKDMLKGEEKEKVEEAAEVNAKMGRSSECGGRKMVRMMIDGVLNWVAEEGNYFLCEVCDFKSSKDDMISHLSEQEHLDAAAQSAKKE